MNENEIKQKLDQLAEFQSARDVAMLEKQSLLDEIYTAEIKARMAEIEAEFVGKTEAVNENIAALEAEIKQAIITHGASVKNANIDLDYLQNRFNLSPQLRNIIANTLWCADMDTINYKVPVEYQQINNFLSAKDSVRDDDAEQSVQPTWNGRGKRWQRI